MKLRISQPYLALNAPLNTDANIDCSKYSTAFIANSICKALCMVYLSKTVFHTGADAKFIINKMQYYKIVSLFLINLNLFDMKYNWIK